MPPSTATRLTARRREPAGSRATRRLRRSGRVPGIVYGSNRDPEAFDVDGRELRQALAARGAVIELTIDGGAGQPVVLKDEQRHPVRGQTVHIDLLRVRLDRAIEATVPLELTGVDDAPGVRGGGVLEQVTRELTVSALPTAIPDRILHDVSALDVNETLTLASLTAPADVELRDDPETVIATIVLPRLETEEEIEQETELVGEREAPEEGVRTAEPGSEAEAPGE